MPRKAETETEKLLCKAVIENNIVEAKRLIEELKNSNRFCSDLLNDASYHKNEIHFSANSSLVFLAVQNNNFDMVKLLLLSGFDNNISSPFTNTSPLDYAVGNKKNIDIIKLLLNYPVDVNHANGSLTPLGIALIVKYIEAVELLIPKANINTLGDSDILQIINLPHSKFLSIFNKTSPNRKIELFKKFYDCSENSPHKTFHPKQEGWRKNCFYLDEYLKNSNELVKITGDSSNIDYAE